MFSLKMSDILSMVFLLTVLPHHVSCQIPGADIVDNLQSAAKCIADVGLLHAAVDMSGTWDCDRYKTLEKTCDPDAWPEGKEKTYKDLRDKHYKEKCGCSQMSMSIALGFACLLIALFHNTGIPNIHNV